jgi:hypothetical protein
MGNQPNEDRREKRRYREWQHDDWNAEFRNLIPAPEPEGYMEIAGWGGAVLRRTPEMSGDYLTWSREPWKL